MYVYPLPFSRERADAPVTQGCHEEHLGPGD